MKYLSSISGYLLAIVLIGAGLDQIAHYRGFVTALDSMLLIPDGMHIFLAIPLILSEIWVGVGLVLPIWRATAAAAASGLLLISTIALMVNYYFAPGAICGIYFSITLGNTTGFQFLQNIVFLGLALSVWHDHTPPRLDPSALYRGSSGIQDDGV